MDSVKDDAQGVGYRPIEVLTGPGRRRKWSDDDRARIVAEALVPGAVVTEVTRRRQISPQQLFDWRRQARIGVKATASAVTDFVPIVPEAAEVASQLVVPTTPTRAPPLVEVRLAGAVLRVAPGTDMDLLAAVLRAFRVAAA
jgi:transposase